MKKLLLFGAMALSNVTFAQVPNYVPTNGLVGWWPFNGNVNDESGNGNNGVLNGPILSADRFGSPNSSYSLNKSNYEYINVSQTNNLNILSNISISLWTYINSSGPYNHYVNKTDPNGSPTGIQFVLSSNAQGIYFYYGSNPQYFQTNTTVSLGMWHHLSVTYNYDGNPTNSECKFYVDGICTDSFPTTVNLLPSTFDLKFGSYANASFNTVDGIVDDIGIWNRALTQCEIQDLYNAQLNSATGIDAGPDQIVCEGNSITLSGSGGTNYIWNNTIVDGIPFVPTATIDYTLLGEDVNGCVGTDTMHVEVIPNSTSTQTETALDSYTWPVNNQTYTQSGTYTAVIPNAAGCDSTITLNLTLDFTGIGENGANFLAVYPNPTTSMLTIEGEWIVNKEYTLVDIQGRDVLKGTFKSNKETIDLKNIARGQYLLRVERKELKVVKE